MTPVPQSPYARALGERIADLHPRLRTYFQAVPEGMVGVGIGTFQRVGTLVACCGRSCACSSSAG
ncbi:hypothetical protein [Microbacterium sp. BLY]|uniref:hypothetical protein n=1 Tax=Microbacterium sp. BLY TaxID=2823280 RepID=UPI001FF09B73|nr:hypothetical protein [Microbacterium sp. BLY]